MSFADARGRLRAAAFAAFGEAGTWSGAPAQIRRVSPDAVMGLPNGGQIAGESVVLKVRRQDVAEPADRDVVTIGDEHFRVDGDPVADRRREVWLCQAKRIAA